MVQNVEVITARAAIPAALTGANSKAAEVTVLEETYPVVKASDPSLITVSEAPGFSDERFNTLAGVRTREVTITGLELRFDGTIPVLEALAQTRDVSKLNIVADEVRITNPLHWKRADVTITARRLVFREQGCIDTTPEAFPDGTTAVSEHKSDDGRPLDEAGKPLNKGKDGLPGENAGNIHLNVRDLDLGGTDVKRFLLNGSPGQKGERGGIIRYEDETKNPKNKSTLSTEDITTAINNSANSTGDLNGLRFWWYPSDSGGRTGKLYEEMVARQVLGSGKVTDIRLFLRFEQFLARLMNEITLPGGARTKHDQTWTTTLSWGDQRAPTAMRRPRDGEPAYPSGATGRGGDGGTLTTPAAQEGRRAHAEATRASAIVAHTAEGGAAPLSDRVAGGAAGTPQEWWAVDVLCVQKNMVGTGEPGARIYGPYYSAPGASAEGSSQGDGKPGRVEATGDPDAWIDPINVRIVLDRARTLYARGHREESVALILPYLRAFKERSTAGTGLPQELAVAREGMQNLARNCAQNLDVYGNPPGWVPRFSADSYLQLYLGDRDFSYKFCYVMTKALAVMDDLQHTSQLLDVANARNEDAIDRLHHELGGAFLAYDKARDDLESSLTVFAEVKDALTKIEDQAQHDAEHAEEEQRIIKGAFKLVSAVAKAIPVYQPMLSAVGDIAETVGSVVADATAPKPPDQAGMTGYDAVQRIADSVSTTLEKNADTFKDRFDAAQKKKYKDVLSEDESDLDEKIALARAAVTEMGANGDKAALEAHNAALDTAGLAGAGPSLSQEMLDLIDKDGAIRREIDECDSLMTNIGRTSPNDPSKRGELAALARKNLGATRKKLYAELEGVNRLVDDLTAKEAAGAAAAKEQLAAARKARDDLATKKTELDKLLTEKAATTSIAEANKTFGTVVDATTRLTKGVADVAGALGSMFTPVPADDPAVANFRQTFLKSKYKDQYDAALKKLDKAQEAKLTAVSGLQQCNQFILRYAAELNDSVRRSIDLGHARQSFALGIDTGVATAMRELQRAASERMDYYLYLVRKAFMYEELRAVGEGIATINEFVERFDKQIEHARGAVDQPDLAKALDAAKVHPSDGAAYVAELDQVAGRDFSALGDAALSESLAELAEQLLKNRSKEGPANSSHYSVNLPRELLADLSLTGRFGTSSVRSLIPSLDAFFDQHYGVRVASITVDELQVRCDAGFDGPIRLELSMGREFILKDSAGNFFKFRLANADRPATYGFAVNDLRPVAADDHADTVVKTGSISPDESENVDPLFRTIMDHLGVKVDYREMAPSASASLSGQIFPGPPALGEIEKLRLTVRLTHE